MINYFLITSLTAAFTLVAYVPFIDLLYRLKIQKDDETTRTDILGIANKILHQLHGHKKGTPTAGGILVFVIVAVTFWLINRYRGVDLGFDQARVFIILLAFVLYGLFGFYDDVRKTIPNRKAEKLHIKARYQFVIQLIISSIISSYGVKSGLFSIEVPGLFAVQNQILVFLISILVITFMVNAVNITDGLDGLGSGAFLITVGTLGVVFLSLGLSTELLFLALLGGAIMGYLYYNINPARVFNGDANTFAIGAVFTVLMLTNKLFFVMPFFAFLYLVEGGSSLAQGFSRKFFGKKIFHIAPLHHHFEYIGWPETKVTMRFWLLHLFFSIFGLAVYFL